MPTVRPRKIGFSLEVLVLAQGILHPPDVLANALDGARRQILGNSTGADVAVVHPQPGDELEDVQRPLPLTEADRHHRECTDLHATGRDGHQVRGDAVDLHHHHPDDGGPFRDLVGDAQQPLDAQHVGGFVEERRQIVHPGAERHALRPRPVLHVLLDAGVQISDAGTGLGDGLAVEFEDEPENTVRRRVLRAHVDHDPLLARDGGADDVVPVLAADVVDGAFGRLPMSA